MVKLQFDCIVPAKQRSAQNPTYNLFPFKLIQPNTGK